jgi:hypothetical protein
MTDWNRAAKPQQMSKAGAAFERVKAVASGPAGEFAAQAGGGKGTAILTAARKGVEYGGKGLMGGLAVAGALAGGVQVGSGVNKMLFEDGHAAEGAVDVAEGSANLGMSIGTMAAVKSGALVAEGGIAAGGVALFAGVAAGAAVMLAAETARAAINGEETPVDVADKFYGTHFGNVVGWIAGDYSK